MPTGHGDFELISPKANFGAATAAGPFGVPTLAIDRELFRGDNAFDVAVAVPGDPAMHALPVAASRT